MAVVLLQVVFLIELKSPGPCNPRASGLKTQKPKQSMVIYCFHVVYLQGIEITSQYRILMSYIHMVDLWSMLNC